MTKMISILIALLLVSPVLAVSEPTFAELAVFCAKGYFKEYIPADASLDRCVVFLNEKGICISLFDLMDAEVKVTPEDFARVVGQSTLLFLGEAELAGGCIKKPQDAKSWVDYCLLNDVSLKNLWSRFILQVENGAFPEVDVFFGGGS